MMVTERRARARARARSDAGEVLLRVNVGGLRRSVRRGTLQKFPDTRLAKLLQCRSEEDILTVCDDYDVQQKEFYFDRNPGLFPYLLHFYQTGKLHIMDELCVFSFRVSQEMAYWGIDDVFLDSCCSSAYHERKLGSRRRASWDGSDAGERDDMRRLHTELQHLAEARCGGVRRRLWLTLENPGYSLPSKLFSAASVAVLLASLAAMCVKSLPEYQTLDRDGNLTEGPAVDAVEVLSTCWFTLEVRACARTWVKVVMRFLLAPNRKQFLRHPLNVIDVASVLPVYVTLVCEWTLGAQSELGDLGRVLQVPPSTGRPTDRPALPLMLFLFRPSGFAADADLPSSEAGSPLHRPALTGGHAQAQLPRGGHPDALLGRGRVRLLRDGLHRRVPAGSDAEGISWRRQ
ncbi:delayed-rectifier potassium channel regulatory subunit KCNS2-like isoform X6 [Vanacampus margaritifer]